MQPCDAYGRLVDFVLVPGQAHELAPSLSLLKRLPKAPTWALADMACDAAEFPAAAKTMGATPVVPSRRNAKQKHPLSRLYLPPSQFDRTLLVAPEGIQGHRHPIR
jgi:hypothetical protein